jgi:hypothetical protein
MTALLTERHSGAAQRLPTLHDTPGRLRALRAAIVTLALTLAVVSVLATTFALNGTHRITRSTEPLLVSAETIYSSLADADTTAALAFLSGGLEPAAQTQRYDADIDRVGDQLARAAGRIGESGPAADSLRSISAQLPVYAGLIQSARANNRQGFPVGASYLGQASALSREVLLPAADRLLSLEQQQLRTDYQGARARTWLLVTALVTLALLAVLLTAQLFLSRRTHRLLNLGLLAATGALVVLVILGSAVLLGQHHRLTTAERDGSTPVALAAQARITALVQHGDESLTLVSRGTSAAYEADFAKAQLRLLGDPTHPGLLPQRSPARALVQSYAARHTEVRTLDDGGNYNDAVALATSMGTEGAARAFADLDQALATAVTTDQARFVSAGEHADRGLALVRVLAPILALLIGLLAVLGIRTRLEEYR